MTKRRVRIERWRAECKRKEQLDQQLLQQQQQQQSNTKKWSLENESDDEEDVKTAAAPSVSLIVDDDDVIEVPMHASNSPLSAATPPPPHSLAASSAFGKLQQQQQQEPTIGRMPSASLSKPGSACADIVSLVDDDDADGNPAPVRKTQATTPTKPMEVEDEEDDDIDPLDAFMQEIKAEVRKAKGGVGGAATSSSCEVLVVTGVAKKAQATTTTRKGEMMEQNQDGLEYSSEEEQEDIKDTAANLANKHKKELAKIDHTGVDYQPFRKNFYREVPELTKLTAEEVTAYKAELEGILVKGKGCPRPIKTWAHSGISKKELDVLKKMAFEKPTPIQCQAIPAVMSGRDLIGIAKTGSGKTLAFILPMFRHIKDQSKLEEAEGPIAIIMTPTRELCMQIGKDIRRFSKPLGLRAVCVYGGTGKARDGRMTH